MRRSYAVLLSGSIAAAAIAVAACGGGVDDAPADDSPTRTGNAPGRAPSGGKGAELDAQVTPPCGGAGEACCAEVSCNAGLVCAAAGTCQTAVEPYACPAGAPEAVFVAETPPAATLAPWARAYASLTFANCGTATWSSVPEDAPSGVKLGTVPHDSTTFTRGRLKLPADVPPGSKVTIALALHAPPLTGSHAYGFELLREGVAWLGAASPAHRISIESTPSAPIAICPGVMADPSGVSDASQALEACINAAAPGQTLSLPAGIYRVSSVLVIDKPMTVTTAGASTSSPSCLAYDGPQCAVLRADADTLPSAANTRGFVRLGSLQSPASAITLDHVVVDGNREARLTSTAAANCAAGNNGDGINVGANCTGCKVLGSGSVRALCGSALEWEGDGVVIQRSDFLANGDHTKLKMWSDGLTIHKSDGAQITENRFVDNSDVGFISGGGINARYAQNTALQLTQTAFAAMMLDNFNNVALGDFSGAVLENNFIGCSAPCHFGIELGPHPWYPSPNIKGGTVTGNTVVGANIQINAQGAGTAALPTVVSGNTLAPTPASAAFDCGVVNGLSPLNVSAESVVDLKGGEATGTISVPCP